MPCCSCKGATYSTPNLTFGVGLNKSCTPDRIHPKLYKLLLYLYVNGSQVSYLLPLNPIHLTEAKELKSSMKRIKTVAMCNFSESAALAVLKCYLKELPQPILNKQEWENICFQFFKNEALNVQSIAKMGREINKVARQMNPTERYFFLHLVVVIREMSKDRKRRKIQFDRLVILLDFLGPVLMRTTERRYKEKIDKLSGADKVFLTFVICFADEIFGNELNHLFPPQVVFKNRNTYEPPFKLFG